MLSQLAAALKGPPEAVPVGASRSLLQCCVCKAFFGAPRDLLLHVGPRPLLEAKSSHLSDPFAADQEALSNATFMTAARQGTAPDVQGGPPRVNDEKMLTCLRWKRCTALRAALPSSSPSTWECGLGMHASTQRSFLGYDAGVRPPSRATSLFRFRSLPACRAREMLRRFGVFFSADLMRKRLGALAAEPPEAACPFDEAGEDGISHALPRQAHTPHTLASLEGTFLGGQSELQQIFPDFAVFYLGPCKTPEAFKGPEETLLHGKRAPQQQAMQLTRKGMTFISTWVFLRKSRLREGICVFFPTGRKRSLSSGGGLWGAPHAKFGSAVILLEATPYGVFGIPRTGEPRCRGLRWALAPQRGPLGLGGPQMPLRSASEGAFLPLSYLPQLKEGEPAAAWAPPSSSWVFSSAGAEADVAAVKVRVQWTGSSSRRKRLDVSVRSFGLPIRLLKKFLLGTPSLKPWSLAPLHAGGTDWRSLATRTLLPFARRRAVAYRGCNFSLYRCTWQQGGCYWGIPLGPPAEEIDGVLTQKDKQTLRATREVLRQNWRENLKSFAVQIELSSAAAGQSSAAAAAGTRYERLLRIAAAEEASAAKAFAATPFAAVYNGLSAVSPDAAQAAAAASEDDVSGREREAFQPDRGPQGASQARLARNRISCTGSCTRAPSRACTGSGGPLSWVPSMTRRPPTLGLAGRPLESPSSESAKPTKKSTRGFGRLDESAPAAAVAL
ncbi:hypothetical protein cyc_09043 [Cyclospora cayetanensis]|uniref:Uncharacterized protein n=1 Tax=Cyclospora cayetanensis TaxID=88456 RepID=A0A1D3D5Q4_9EIME|nr:hypothetical protein cyc_09043 [Cyclospora cayetanensis]